MSSHATVVAAFVILATTAVAVDLRGRHEGSRLATFGEMLGRAQVTRPGRAVTLFAWWWLGWHCLAR
jgi:hypothetical protein